MLLINDLILWLANTKMTPNDTSESRLETTYVPGEETRLTIHEGWPGLAWSPLIKTTRNSFIFLKKNKY